MFKPTKRQAVKMGTSLILLAVSVSLLFDTLGLLKNRERLHLAETEVLSLKDAKKDLEESLEFKKTPEFVEEIARNELSLVKPGEKVYVVLNNGDLVDVNGAKHEKPLKLGENRPNWQAWWDLFF